MPEADSRGGDAAQFFDGYARAFETYDAGAIADHFAYPGHVASDSGSVTLFALSDRASWVAQLGDLLARYRQIGVARARVAALLTSELSPRLMQAHVHWELFDPEPALLYDFHNTYTLARIEDAWKIVALISRDELARYRECLALRAERSRGQA